MSQKTASSRSLLECIEDNLIQKSPLRGKVVLDLLLTSSEELKGEVHTHGSLSCRAHALVKIMIWRDTGQTEGKVKILKLPRASFWFYKGLVAGSHSETDLRNEEAKESYQLFKGIFLREQELSLPICKKSCKEGRTSACLSKVLPVKLKCEGNAYTMEGGTHLGKNIGILLRSIGMGSEKLRTSWRWIWQGIWRLTRRAFTDVLLRKGRCTSHNK